MAVVVTAIHTFVAEHDDELEFQAGEKITVIEKDEAFGDGWWRVSPASQGSLTLPPPMSHAHVTGHYEPPARRQLASCMAHLVPSGQPGCPSPPRPRRRRRALDQACPNVVRQRGRRTHASCRVPLPPSPHVFPPRSLTIVPGPKHQRRRGPVPRHVHRRRVRGASTSRRSPAVNIDRRCIYRRPGARCPRGCGGRWRSGTRPWVLGPRWICTRFGSGPPGSDSAPASAAAPDLGRRCCR